MMLGLGACSHLFQVGQGVLLQRLGANDLVAPVLDERVPQGRLVGQRQVKEPPGRAQDAVLHLARDPVADEGEEAGRHAGVAHVVDDPPGGVGGCILEVGADVYGWDVEAGGGL